MGTGDGSAGGRATGGGRGSDKKRGRNKTSKKKKKKAAGRAAERSGAADNDARPFDGLGEQHAAVGRGDGGMRCAEKRILLTGEKAALAPT